MTLSSIFLLRREAPTPEENLWECFFPPQVAPGLFGGFWGVNISSEWNISPRADTVKGQSTSCSSSHLGRVTHHQGGVFVTLKLPQAGVWWWTPVRVPPATPHRDKPVPHPRNTLRLAKTLKKEPKTFTRLKPSPRLVGPSLWGEETRCEFWRQIPGVRRGWRDFKREVEHNLLLQSILSRWFLQNTHK